MACTALPESLQRLQAGDVTAEGVKRLLSDCPQICDHVQHTDAFDLAGPGIYISIAIQAVLIVLLGTIQSFISYIISPHTSSSTKLTIARLQVVFDKVCSTAIFICIMTLITSYVRLRQHPGSFECNMIQKLLDTQSISLILALIARIVQETPSKVVLPARRWGLGQVWTVAQALTLTIPYLKSMSGKTLSAVLSRLCAATTDPTRDHPTTYPAVALPPSGNTQLLLSIVVFVAVIVIGIASDCIRNWFWTMLKKIFTARLTLVIAVSLWSLTSLTGLGLNVWLLVWLRHVMLQAGVPCTNWDFSQVVAVGLWIPVFYQLLLTCLVSLNLQPVPNSENFSIRNGAWNLFTYLICDLYEWNVGDPPKIQEDAEQKDKEEKSEPALSQSAAVTTEEEQTTANKKSSMMS